MTTGKQKQSRGTDKKNGFKKFISKSHSLKRVDWMQALDLNYTVFLLLYLKYSTIY